MAYMIELARRCVWHDCSRRATHEVRNRVNAVQGVYCRSHATQITERLTKIEQARS